MPLPVPFGVTEWDREWYTEDDYFAWEEHSPVRWEFRPAHRADSSGQPLGVIHAMPGADLDHSSITVNLLTMLMITLKEAGAGDWRVFNCQLKFHTPDGRNTYPDISVVRGKANYYRGRNDILTNPILLGEVLSPTTEAYDRGEKWASYQTIPTLHYCLILAADRIRVELYTRAENDWQYAAYEGADAFIPLPMLGVTLAMGQLYEGVEFE